MAITAQLPLRRRRVIQSRTSSADKSTVVSILPIRIEEKKHTLFPGCWVLEPGTYDNPSCTIVGPSSWFRDDGEQAPILEIPVFSIEIAESLVVDYSNGILECDMGGRRPGLFFLEGAVTPLEVKTKHKARLDDAQAKQKAWFLQLVKVGDSLWARSSGNPTAISNDMRLAAKELGLEKPWTKDYAHVTLVPCKACGSMKNPNFAVCAVCKNVDLSVPEAKELKFA